MQVSFFFSISGAVLQTATTVDSWGRSTRRVLFLRVVLLVRVVHRLRQAGYQPRDFLALVSEHHWGRVSKGGREGGRREGKEFGGVFLRTPLIQYPARHDRDRRRHHRQRHPPRRGLVLARQRLCGLPLGARGAVGLRGRGARFLGRGHGRGSGRLLL